MTEELSAAHLTLRRYKRERLVLLGLFALSLAILLGYLLIGISPSQFDYIFPKRLEKVIAVLLTGIAVAVSSILFQTISNNRILTPAIIGFDSLYLLIQGASVFLLGSSSAAAFGYLGNYFINIFLMVVFAELLYRFLFQREGSYIYFILLAGVVFGMVFRSGFTFFTLLLDPEEFDIVQTKMFATFNVLQPELIGISAVLILLSTLVVWQMRGDLDVYLLGRENAVNLGIDADKLQKKVLRIIAVLVAASTALVGPITFLGLLVVNIAYQVFHTYKHTYLLIGTSLISWAALFFGLFGVERIFAFTTNLSVIINGIGGSYFIYLLLKESD